MEDKQLVVRAQSGDVGAYEELVRRYQRAAHRTAFFITGDAADAEDAAQTAFVKGFYALGRFRKDAPFRPWILKIAANEARNRRRSAGRRTTLQLRLSEDRSRADEAPSPEAAVLAEEPRLRLLAAMNRLSESDRLVLAYRYFMELSEEEIAAALACARGTVKSRLSRSTARLRAELAADEPVPEGIDR